MRYFFKKNVQSAVFKEHLTNRKGPGRNKTELQNLWYNTNNSKRLMITDVNFSCLRFAGQDDQFVKSTRQLPHIPAVGERGLAFQATILAKEKFMFWS